jgi:hypothetical protein
VIAVDRDVVDVEQVVLPDDRRGRLRDPCRKLVAALNRLAVAVLRPDVIRQGAANRVASLFYLVPPTTALLAWPLFGETYSLLPAAGMGLGMLAVWLVSKP